MQKKNYYGRTPTGVDVVQISLQVSPIKLRDCFESR